MRFIKSASPSVLGVNKSHISLDPVILLQSVTYTLAKCYVHIACGSTLSIGLTGTVQKISLRVYNSLKNFIRSSLFLLDEQC